MLKALLDLIYPVRCPVCEDIVVPKGERICPSCREKLQRIQEPYCMKCGKPIDAEEKEFCSDCIRRAHHYIQGYSLWVYDDVTRKSIKNFKDRNKKENGVFYIDELIRAYGGQLRKLGLDVIIPVPLHRTKCRRRGYNQANILAEGISKALNIPVQSELLIRRRNTLPQKQLNDKERLRNLKEAFTYNRKAGQSFYKPIQRVLLVDDIYTTGSTIEACTLALQENGVSEVYFLTLCIGRGY